MSIKHDILIIGLIVFLLLALPVSCRSQSEVPIEPQPPISNTEDKQELESIVTLLPEPTPEPTPAPTPEPTPAPTPAPTPEPTPAPTPAPTPHLTYQKIEGTIKAGYVVGAYISYTKEFKGRDEIKGFIEFGGEYVDDPNTKWYFQIVDPDGKIERSWLGCHGFSCNNPIHLDFNHVASTSGLYGIRVISNSHYRLNIFIKITPDGWRYSKSGFAKYGWLVAK